jgi:hypothetical protein
MLSVQLNTMKMLLQQVCMEGNLERTMEKNESEIYGVHICPLFWALLAISLPLVWQYNTIQQ